MFKYYLFRFWQMLACIIPLRGAYLAATLLSDLKYTCSPRDRSFVKDNLRVICGDGADINFMARNLFRNFGKYLVEFFRMHTFDNEFICRHVTIDNQYGLDQALARGKGVIIMTAHIGNWELGGFILGRLGYSLTAIALPHKNQALNNLFDRQRAEGGITVVPAQSAIRRCIRTLKGNGIVALVADRDFSATGKSMNFFGRSTMIPRGIAMFAQRTGATVLPMFLRRKEDQEFVISIGEPFKYPEHYQDLDEKIFIDGMMKQQVEVLEQEIRKDPSDWLIFRRFWINEKKGPERITST